jgi:protein-S-isoprenylcysteine O-methyltransferase Ste14
MSEEKEKKQKYSGLDREYPRAHLYHSLLPVIFIIVWIIDTLFLSLTVWLNEFVPLVLRIVFFVVFFGLALIFIQLSHKVLFKEHEPSDTLIIKGILKRTRNPMYFGILLVYLSFILLSISVICIVLFFGVIILYDKMVNFEEDILEEMFGQAYLEYKKKVPKWIPKIGKVNEL